MQFTPFDWYKLKNIAVLKNNLQSYFTNDIIRDPNFLSMSFSRRRVVTYHSATSSTIHWNPSSKYWRQPTVGDNIRHDKVHLPGSIANWSRLTTLRHISLDSSTFKARPRRNHCKTPVHVSWKEKSVVKEGLKYVWVADRELVCARHEKKALCQCSVMWLDGVRVTKMIKWISVQR